MVDHHDKEWEGWHWRTDNIDEAASDDDEA
jgi:hypothetical protein